MQELTGLGFTLPREAVQPALDAFSSQLTKNYPLGIHADSVQVTDSGVTSQVLRAERDHARPASRTPASQGSNEPVEHRTRPRQPQPGRARVEHRHGVGRGPDAAAGLDLDRRPTVAAIISTARTEAPPAG